LGTERRPFLNISVFTYGLWGVVIVTFNVIIEITIGIEAARKVPTTLNRDFKVSWIKILSASSDFMSSEEMYCTEYP
jgi:hypothetical protein